MSRIAKITTVVLVCGITLSAAAYFLRDTAVAGVVMNKVNTYRLNQGLVGWWTFDGTDVNWTTGRVSDKSGNNKYGTIIGMATATAPIAGKIGQALQFDGVDDNVDVSNFSTVTASPFTWSFWYNGKGGSAEDIISLGFYRYCGSNMGGNFRCTVDGDAYNGVSASDSLVSDGNWHLISYVYTNDSLSELYVDGVLTDSVANTVGTAGLSDVSLGYNPGGAYGAGTLDDVRIYNRALSASEVKLLYTTTAGSKMNTSKNVIPGSTLQQGLVGLWSFDGPDVDFRTNKAFDRSGQGNHGEFVNMATSTATTGGKVGQALKFDGVDDQINLGDQNAWELGSGNRMTLSFWIKRDGSQQMNIFGRDNGDWTTNNWTWNVYSTGDNVGFAMGTGGTSQENNDIATLPLNEWIHFTVVVGAQGESVDFYANGVLLVGESFMRTLGQLRQASGPFFIGGEELRYTVGSIDDVRIYNRALSASEVKDLYTATAGTKVNHSQNTVPGSTLQQGLVGLWSFNGPDLTDKVYDRSGQGNNGYFVGNATNSAKTSGKIGQGLRFDGVNDYVAITDSPIFDLTTTASYSWSFWIRPNNFNEWNAVWTQDDVSAGSPPQLAIYAHTTGDTAHGPLTNGISAEWTTSLGPDNFLILHSTNNALSTSTWSHVVVLYDGSLAQSSRMKIYINGVDRTDTGDISSTGTISDITVSSIRIGATTFAGEYADGKIDETRIYNRALSAAEVKLLYNLGH